MKLKLQSLVQALSTSAFYYRVQLTGGHHRVGDHPYLGSNLSLAGDGVIGRPSLWIAEADIYASLVDLGYWEAVWCPSHSQLLFTLWS